jgi:hypothetical protein
VIGSPWGKWKKFFTLKEAIQDFYEETFHFRISLIIGIREIFYFFTWIIITFQQLTQMEELMLFGISFASCTMYGMELGIIWETANQFLEGLDSMIGLYLSFMGLLSILGMVSLINVKRHLND